MGSSLPLLAGTVSTVVFACSTLPMLRKAAVTKDLASYSLGNIVMANVGNVVHSLYGPTCRWARSGCCTAST
jgi:hypothetical protein